MSRQQPDPIHLHGIEAPPSAGLSFLAAQIGRGSGPCHRGGYVKAGNAVTGPAAGRHFFTRPKLRRFFPARPGGGGEVSRDIVKYQASARRKVGAKVDQESQKPLNPLGLNSFLKDTGAAEGH